MTTKQDAEKVTIILHSSGYDHASYALTLALVAMATGMEAYILLTHGGLRRFTRGQLEGMGEETTVQARQDIEFGLMTGALNPLGKQLADAKELGLNLYACVGAMSTSNIRREDLLPEVDEDIGLGTFLDIARTASVNWYI